MWVSQPAITKLNQVYPPILALGIRNAQNYQDRYVFIYDIFAYACLCFVMVLRVQIVYDQSKYNFKTKTIMSILKKRTKGLKSVRSEGCWTVKPPIDPFSDSLSQYNSLQPKILKLMW